jgi:RHH-type proline utilization regulon transcriptional repressor/proline dehydrogenase/delta 1-pyrroline-5-carboxylate dehydrogenase
VEALLQGAMQELRLGDPLAWGTDIGPVIDADARQQLLAHIALCRDRGSLLCQAPLPSAGPAAALLVPPTAIRLQHLAELQREVFGPILHIIHYAEGDIDPLVDEINAAGYGLTAGIHSRNDSWARQLAARLRVGNCYINRDMIGAVVESQPFGGRGLSGTGPKAGGPHYLLRFISEKTVTVNTAAFGGDAGLLSP